MQNRNNNIASALSYFNISYQHKQFTSQLCELYEKRCKTAKEKLNSAVENYKFVTAYFNLTNRKNMLLFDKLVAK